MRRLPAPLFAIFLTAFKVAADPNAAPDIWALVESELGNGFRVAELTITTEELRRNESGAIYEGEFAASVILPVTLYHEIGHGDGYRLVGNFLERGETVPAFGSAVAVYTDGRWAVEINLLDLQLPGGRPFSEFRSPGTVVLEAGTDLVDRFLAQREVAFRNAEALRAQDARIEKTETAALLARALSDVAAREASLSDALAALARSEAAGAETAASLAAARAELGRVRSGAEADAAVIRELLAQAGSAQAELDAKEAARLAEAAIAAALRERLRNADAELTALSLRLEEARKEAEETLALLAAADAAEEGLTARLAKTVARLELAEGLLEEAEARDRASRVRIDALGSRLNQALARVAAEQRRRAALEAAEAARLRRAKAALDEEVVDLAAYRSEFFGTLRRVLGDREGVRIVGDRFLFSSEVLFESGSATLRPEGRASIAEVAGILEEVADEIPANLDWVLRVDGHTDSAPVVVAGAFADNWELSAGRALSVVKYMTGTLGFPPERLAAAGFGEYRPVNPEDTDAARAQNRRIELKLTER